MPSNVLFTNPVVAQQQMAADQFRLAQRQQELADRDALLGNIARAQEMASRERMQRDQTSAYREASQGQNQIGMTRAQNDVLMGNRRLDIDSLVAENSRRFQEQELATRKAIAEINANATRMRPQDLVDLEQTALENNMAAEEFNQTAPNAAMILKSLAEDLRKKDEDALTKEEDGFFTSTATARKTAKAKLDEKPAAYYLKLALKQSLADGNDLSPFVSITGNDVVPNQRSLIAIENGKLKTVAPKTASTNPAPAAPADWRSLMAGAMGQGAANPASPIPNLTKSAAFNPRVLTNRAGQVDFKINNAR